MADRNGNEIFVPASLDAEAVDELMMRSWAAIDRSTAILNRLAAANELGHVRADRPPSDTISQHAAPLLSKTRALVSSSCTNASIAVSTPLSLNPFAISRKRSISLRSTAASPESIVAVPPVGPRMRSHFVLFAISMLPSEG
jgi:hypothetical protein